MVFGTMNTATKLQSFYPMCALLLLFSLSLVPFPIAFGQQDPATASTITSVTPTSGSIRGGTVLTVLGTNFDSVASNNIIYIGNGKQGSLCTVIPLRSSSTHLECETEAPHGSVGVSPRGLDVNVVAFGYTASCTITAGCKFSFLFDNSPLLDSVFPEWLGTQEVPLSASGAQFSRSDTNPTHADVTFKIGDALCDTGDYAFSSASLSCQTGAVGAGSYDISLLMANGDVTEYPGRTNVDTGANRAPAQVLVVPNITKISPLRGSMGGGQLLTLHGFGFDQNPVKNVISIADGLGGRVPCPVDSVSTRYIVCRTQPGSPLAPFTAPPLTSEDLATPVTAELWYIGTSSMTLEQFRMTVTALQPQLTRQVARLGETVRPNLNYYQVVRYSALFVPPESGNFTFYAAADDFADLILDGQYLIWQCAYSTTCMAENVTLTEGEAVRLSSTFKNNQGSAWLTVSVSCQSGKHYSTIPTSLLRPLPPTAPVSRQIHVAVNGIDALCVSTKDCPVYEYDSTLTPYITQVTPSDAVVSGAEITINGLNFPTTGATVYVGSATVCRVTELTDTKILCMLKRGVLGRQKVQVRFASIGDAIGTFYISGTIEVTFVLPTMIPTYGGTTLTVLGSGFGDDASLLEVRVAGVLCTPIVSVTDDTLLCKTGALPNVTDVSFNVTVDVLDATYLDIRQAVPLSQDHVVPGFTNTTARAAWASLWMGSSRGNDDVSIRVAAVAGYGTDPIVEFVSEENAAVRIACRVYLAVGNRIGCRTPAATPGSYDLIVRSRMNTTHTETVGTFLFADMIRGISTDSGWSPHGGNYITMVVDIAEPDVSEIEMSIEGTPCNEVNIGMNTGGSITAACYTDKPWLVWTGQSDLKQGRSVFRYNAAEGTDVSELFDISTRIAQAENYLFVDSNQRLLTKQKFAAPLRVRARLIPTATYNAAQSSASCLRLRALIPDITSYNYGVEGFANAPSGYVGLRYNTWTAVNSAQSSFNSAYLRNVNYNSSEPVELVLDIRGTQTHFFVDGVLVATYSASVFTEGHVGFTSNCQGIYLESLEVEDMSDLGVRISHKGKRLPYKNLAGYNPTLTYSLIRVLPNPIYFGNNLIQFTTVGYQWGNWYAVQYPNTPFTSTLPRFCTNPGYRGTSISNRYEANCSVSEQLEAGVYRLQFGNGHGFAVSWENAIEVTVEPLILGYTVEPQPTENGAFLVLQGASLPVSTQHLFQIFLGPFECEVISMTVTSVACAVNQPITINTTLSVVFNNETIPLTVKKLKATIVATAPVPSISRAYMHDRTNAILQIIGGNFTSGARVKLNDVDCTVYYLITNNIRCYVSSKSWQSHSPWTAQVWLANGALSTTVEWPNEIGLPQVSVGSGPVTAILPLPNLALDGESFPIASFDFSDVTADRHWGPTRRIGSCDPNDRQRRMLSTLRSPNSNYFTALEKTFDFSGAVAWGATVFQVEGEVVLLNHAGSVVVSLGSTSVTFTRVDYVCPEDPLCPSSSRDCVLSFRIAIPAPQEQTELTLRIKSWATIGLRNAAVSGRRADLASLVEAEVNTGASLTLNWLSHSAVQITMPAVESTAVLRVLANAGWNMSLPFAVSNNLAPQITRIAPIDSSNGLSWLPRGEPRLEVSSSGRLGTPNIGSFGWTSSISSLNVFAEGELRSVSFVFTGRLGVLMFGIAAGVDNTASHHGIDVAIYRTDDSNFQIYESGGHVASFGGWMHGAVMTIECIGTDACDAVNYKMEGDIMYTSYRALRGPLRLMGAFYRGNSFVENVQIERNPFFVGQRLNSVVLVGSTSLRTLALSVGGAPCTVTHYYDGAVVCATTASLEDLWSAESATVTVTSATSGLAVDISAPVLPVLLSVISATGSIGGGQQQQYFGALLSRVSLLNCSFTDRISDQQVTCLTNPRPSTTSGSYPIRAPVTATPTVSAFLSTMSYTFSSGSTPSISNVTVIPATVSAFDQLPFNGSLFQTDAFVVVVGGPQDGQTFCDSNSATLTSSYFLCTVSSVLPAGEYTVAVTSVLNGRSVSTRTVSLRPSLNTKASQLQVGTLGGASLRLQGLNLGAGWTVQRTTDNVVVCTLTATAAKNIFDCAVDNTIAHESNAAYGLFDGSSLVLPLPTVSIDASLSPQILDVVPRNGVVRGTVLRLRAVNFIGAVTVQVGAATCRNVLPLDSNLPLNEEQWFSCVVDRQVAEGELNLAVTSSVAGAGTIASTSSTNRHLGVVAAQDPVTSAFDVQLMDFARTNGGDITLWLALSGVRSSAEARDFTVKVENRNCVIDDFTTELILCTFSVPNKFNPKNADIKVTVRRSSARPQTIALPDAVLASLTTLPIVAMMTPESGPAIGGTILTFLGSNFDPNPQMTEVHVGGVRCMTQTVSADLDTITCVTAPMPANHTSIVTVAVRDIGEIENRFHYDAILSLTSASTSAGPSQAVSVEGGALLTITGLGFSTSAQVSVQVGNVECPVTTHTATNVVCTIPASARPIVLPRRSQPRGTVSPQLVNEYAEHPEGAFGITLTMNGVVAMGSLNVRYTLAATPRVLQVGPTNVGPNDVLTIIGSGFAASGNKVSVGSVGLASVIPSTCNVLTESATEITCQLDVQSVGELSVVVSVPRVGNAFHRRGCPEGQFLLCDGSCIANTQCSVAAWGRMRNCSSIVELISGDTFCDSNGGTDLAGTVLRMDGGAIFNMNCPLYSCEGNDCNTTVSHGKLSKRVSTCGKDPNMLTVQMLPVISFATVPTRNSTVNGGLRIELQGQGLYLRTIVLLGGTVSCTPLVATNTYLLCEVARTSQQLLNAPLTAFTDGIAATCTAPVCGGYNLSSITPTFRTLGVAYTQTGPVLSLNTVNTPLERFTSNVNDLVVTVGGEVCTPLPTEMPLNETRTNFSCIIPSLPAATYGVSVRIPEIGYATLTTSTIALAARIYSVAPNETSLAGGAIVTINGHGFSSQMIVRASCALTILSATTSTIIAKTQSCAAGTFGVALTLGSTTYSTCLGGPCSIRYAAANTPVITSSTVVGLNAILLGTFFSGVPTVRLGSFGTCAVTETNPSRIKCRLPNDLLGGSHPFIVSVPPFGDSVVNAQYAAQYSLSISYFTPTSGSVYGGQVVTVVGSGFGTDVALLQVTVEGVPCLKVTLVVDHTTLHCVAPPGTGRATIRVTTSLNAADAASADYRYRTNNVPIVSSVSPSRGSTAGGTMLTIIGSNMDDVTEVFTGAAEDLVLCPQTPLDVSRSTSTTYYCTTAPHATMFEASIVTVYGPTGYGEVTATYQHIDLWSRITTWGNTHLPIAEDSVAIGEGQIVMLDMSPPKLYLIVVLSGQLIFDTNVDINLDCTYIVVNYGRLAIGNSMADPFTKKATIRLWGDRLTPEIPAFGSKVIFMRQGRLDIHGLPRQPTWTRLNGTALAGANGIVVQGPVDWQVGEQIGISSTDFEPLHYERRFIQRVQPVQDGSNSVYLELDQPLEYEHYGVRQCFDALNEVCIDEIAEVMLMTRNVEIVGDPDTPLTTFGAQVFVMPGGSTEANYARITYTEIHQSGQRFLLGRYSVHFHVARTVASSYIIGNSVHDTYNRAFTIHGTNNNTYIDNVVCNTEGHSFFFEDGSEHYNVLRHNLVMGTRASTSLLNTDLSPASFWITNPRNYLYDNVAAGSEHYGFWISPFMPNSVGPTASTNICPYLEPLGAFVGQVSHSHGNYGLNIKPEWYPKSQNCNANSADQQAVIENMTIYKTQIHGINFQTSFGAIHVRGLRIADIGTTDGESSFIWTETASPAATNQSTGVSDSLFIAFTNNQPYRRAARRRGINMPLHDNWFNRNITWVNFIGENWAAEPFLRQTRMKLNYPWGWTYLFKQMRYINSPNRILLRFQHHAVIFDEDGTLGDVEPGSYIVPQTPLFDPVMCPPVPALRSGWPLAACKPSYPIRRLGIGNAADLTFDQLFTIENRTERVYKLNKGYLVTIPTNRPVGILFDSYSTPQSFWWNWNPRYIRDDERALFEVKHLEERLNCTATFDNYWRLPVNPAPLINATVSSNYFNPITRVHTVLHARPRTNMVLACTNCPSYGCPWHAVPEVVDKPCTPFGNANSWSSGVVPGSGADVNVTYNDSICLDSSIPTFPDIYVGSLTVSGILSFTDSMCPSNGGTVRLYVNRFVHIHGGKLRIGDEANPIVSCRVEIVMAELDHFNYTDVSSKTLQPFGARTIALQYGQLYLFGRPAVSMRRLTQSVTAGTTTLSLDGPVNWQVGDRVGIARTDRGPMWEASWPDDSTEVVEIAAISNDLRVITLTAAVRYQHDGRLPQVLGNRTYHVGAEVVLLTRSVTIRGPSTNPTHMPTFRQGWQLNLGCSAVNYQGCVGKEYMSPLKTGVVQLSSVAMYHVGQSGLLHGSIELDGWVQTADTTSFLRNLSLWSPLNSAVMLRHTSEAIEVSDCVFFNVSGGDGLRAISSGNRLIRNIVLAQGPAIPFCTGTYAIQDHCRIGAFRIARRNIVIGNIAASSVGAGFVTDGEACTDVFQWYNNVAHSTRDGVLIYDAPGPAFITWPRVTSLCRTVGGVLTHANSDSGMSLWYVQASIRVVNYTSVDNMMGLVPLLYDPRTDDGDAELSFTVRDSTFAGTWNNQPCRTYQYTCRHSEFNNEFWCNNFMAKGTIMGSVGLVEAVFMSSSYTERTLGEEKFFWSEPDSYHTVRGKSTIDNVLFDNFVGSNACGTKSVAFFQQIFSNDTFHQHLFSRIAWGPGMQAGGELWTKTTYGNVQDLFTHAVPVPLQTVYLDFDDSRYGGFWPDSPNKLWLVDLDGTFTKTGVLTNVLSSQTITRHSTWNTTGWHGFPEGDAIGPVRPECTRIDAWNAFTCTKALSFVSLVIESTASDALDRRVAPLVLCKGDGMMDRYGNPNCPGGIVDFASGPYMKGKGHRMILSRMSRWRFVAENLGNYTLMFRGSPPTSFRVRILDYEHLGIPTSQIGLVLNTRIYGNNAQMRQSVFVDGVKQFYMFGFDYPYVYGSTWPAPLDPPGTHYLDKYVVQGFQRNVLYLTVRPNTRLDVTAENVVSISMSLSMTLSQFYNQKDTFILALANVIGVAPGRLRFVNVVAGTTRRRIGGLDLQVEVDSGNSSTPMNSEAATALSEQVQNMSTEVLSQAFDGATVGSVNAQAVVVTEEESPIRIQDGVPYVLINATLPFAVDEAAIKTSVASYIAAHTTSSPLNTTLAENVVIGNIYTTTANDQNATRFTVVFDYPRDSLLLYDAYDAVTALDNLIAATNMPLLNKSQLLLPSGYSWTAGSVNYNGATARSSPSAPPAPTTEAAPTTPTPPTTTTTAVPTTTTTTTTTEEPTTTAEPTTTTEPPTTTDVPTAEIVSTTEEPTTTEPTAVPSTDLASTVLPTDTTVVSDTPTTTLVTVLTTVVESTTTITPVSTATTTPTSTAVPLTTQTTTSAAPLSSTTAVPTTASPTTTTTTTAPPTTATTTTTEQPTTTTTEAPSTTAATTAVPITTPVPTPNATINEGSSQNTVNGGAKSNSASFLSKDATIGIVVGGVIAAILVVSAIVFFIVYFKAKAAAVAQKANSVERFSPESSRAKKYAYDGGSAKEQPLPPQVEEEAYDCYEDDEDYDLEEITFVEPVPAPRYEESFGMIEVDMDMDIDVDDLC